MLAIAATHEQVIASKIHGCAGGGVSDRVRPAGVNAASWRHTHIVVKRVV